MTPLALLLALAVAPAPGDPPQVPGTLCVERGAPALFACIPRAERLEFEVTVGLGVTDAAVGRMTLEAGVEPHRKSPLLAQGAGEAQGEVAWIRSTVDGSYLGIREHHEVHTRHLPEAWPAIVTRLRQTGSKERRRELLLGVRDGKPTADYRSTGHCKGCERREHFVASTLPWGDERHCKKCDRPEHLVWKDPRVFEIPAEIVDMATSLYLPRTLVRNGLDELQFSLIDKRDLWAVTIRRADRKVLDLPAGKFDAVNIRFSVAPVPGSHNAEDDFEGLFGVGGRIDVWVDVKTGVLLMVEGEVPVGPMSLTARISLEGYEGTPPGFVPVGGD